MNKKVSLADIPPLLSKIEEAEEEVRAAVIRIMTRLGEQPSFERVGPARNLQETLKFQESAIEEVLRLLGVIEANIKSTDSSR